MNNKPETLNTASSLLQLLEQVKLSDKKGIAVAVNNAVIAQARWTNFELNENDKVTIIRATQGG